MAITPLSQLFTVNDLYSQVSLKCGNIANFKTEPYDILVTSKVCIMRAFGLANSAFQGGYQTTEDLAVNATGYIDISAKNYMRVLSVVNTANNQRYFEDENYAAFIESKNSAQTMRNKYGRGWFLMKGQSKILIRQGSAITPMETPLTVQHVRYPVLNYTIADIEPANSPLLDIEDWAFPSILDITVATLTKDRGIDVPGELKSAAEQATALLSEKLTQNNAIAKQANVDNLNS